MFTQGAGVELRLILNLLSALGQQGIRKSMLCLKAIKSVREKIHRRQCVYVEKGYSKIRKTILI